MDRNTSLLDVAPAFAEFGKKAEQYFYSRPGMRERMDAGNFQTISIGRNKDSARGQKGGYHINGSLQTMASAIALRVPSRSMTAEMGLMDREAVMRPSIRTNVTEAVTALARERVRDSMARNPQLTLQQAQSSVADALMKVGYFDRSTGQFVFERVKDGKDALSRVKDSVASGLTTPIWDISQLNKIFRQPFTQMYADRLVSKVGVPNIWANLVQVFLETFEGYARLANVARGDGDFNTSVAAKNRTSTIISEMVNLVIDYESPTPADQRLGSQNGNWLSNATIGGRDQYADLMLVQLENLLYYFGDAAAGFDGLIQIANRDGTNVLYPASQPPAEYLWQNDGAGTGTGPVNQVVGATLLLMLNHMLGERLQSLNFLPVDIVVNCSPILYKALKFSLTSTIYNQNNPLSIINTAFEAEGNIRGTFVTDSVRGTKANFTLSPDPALMPNTPFNPTAEDLMFITFPRYQSALEGGDMSDLIMAPTAIDSMILPSAPGFRDGVVRTALKRIGSLIAPVAGTVHVISGMGINSRYVGPST
jgi:hypothetical protein